MMVLEKYEKNDYIEKNKCRIIPFLCSYMIIGIPILAMIMSVYEEYSFISNVKFFHYIMFSIIFIADLILIAKNRKLLKEIVLIVFLVGILYIVNVYQWPENSSIVKYVLFRRFSQCILAYILFRSIKNYKTVHDFNVVLSIVSLFIVWLIWIITNDFNGVDHLTISYSVLIPSLLFSSESIYYSKKSFTILLALSIFVLFFFGGRSPILIFVIGLILLRLKQSSELRFKNKVIIQNIFLLFIQLLVIVMAFIILN